jgi:hypothetical protein
MSIQLAVSKQNRDGGWPYIRGSSLDGARRAVCPATICKRHHAQYRDEKIVSAIEDRMDDVISRLPAGQRIVSGVEDTHLHTFAVAGNPYVTARSGDSAMGAGICVVPGRRLASAAVDSRPGQPYGRPQFESRYAVLKSAAQGLTGFVLAEWKRLPASAWPWRKILSDAGLLAIFALTSSWLIRG